ncbi:MAG TPA: DUF2723 domain-containing protein, partial [Chloroflexia bacterium]|nr:DUF2723 domain-containing protein [Chloroflexia bacterium]
MVVLLSLLLYTVTLSPTVNFVDSGEFITAGVIAGITHPPGYPLYSLLSIVAAALPGWTAAVRINFLSALFGAIGVGFFYAFILELLSHHLRGGQRRANEPAARTQPDRMARASQRGASGRQRVTGPPAVPPAAPQSITPPPMMVAVLTAATMALVLAASKTYWDWSTQAKLYSLHFAFVTAIFWLGLRLRRALRSSGAP